MQMFWLLVQLDLSAAFETVDRKIILSRPREHIRRSGAVLNASALIFAVEK